MAYNEELEIRLVQLIKERRDIHRVKMFGGLGFLLRGNMCFGIWKDSLILRIGESKAESALKKTNVVPFDITGRAMKGWVMVLPPAFESKTSLNGWIRKAIDFVEQLPRK